MSGTLRPSRFVTLPGGVSAADGLPAGFRAAGVSCGVKDGPRRGWTSASCVSEGPRLRQRGPLLRLGGARRAGAGDP